MFKPSSLDAGMQTLIDTAPSVSEACDTRTPAFSACAEEVISGFGTCGSGYPGIDARVCNR